MNQNLSEKIAIIIPAYNIEKYVEQCLRSLINQTYKNIEIIVVNDGSTDGTLAILEKLAIEDKRIILINQENKGVSETRNIALNKVTADYVMFVDGDDWIDLETCEAVIEEIRKEKADIVSFGYVREYENASLKKSIFGVEKKIIKETEIKEKIYRRLIGPYEKDELIHPEKLFVLSPVWGKVYKSELLKDIKFKPLKDLGVSGEDTFFNLDIMPRVKKYVYIDKFFYHYRKFNENSITKQVNDNIIEQCKKTYYAFQEIIKDRKLDETFKQALNNEFSLDLISQGIKIIKSKNNFKDKYRILKKFINDDIYKEAIKNLDISVMPIHWKIFFWNVKKRYVFVVYFLLICIVKLISKK